MIVPAPPMHQYDDTPMMVSVLYWKKKKKKETCCEHSSAFIFEWIFIILTGNKDNYKSLNEFEFLQNPITNY